jgi:transposase
MSTLDPTLEANVTLLRRWEVISGSGRRRRFSDDDKSRIVEETLAPGAVISEVARRHGLLPQQVFTWRRQLRRPAIASAATEAPAFVPAVVETALPKRSSGKRARQRTSQPAGVSGMIEVEIDGVTVRVCGGAEPKTITAVLRALKSGA